VTDNVAKEFKLYRHTSKLTGLTFVNDYVAFTDATGVVGIVRFPELAVLTFKAHEAKINDIQFTSEVMMGTLTASGQIRIWNIGPILEMMSELPERTK
jgi:hypothetical protein